MGPTYQGINIYTHKLEDPRSLETHISVNTIFVKNRINFRNITPVKKGCKTAPDGVLAPLGNVDLRCIRGFNGIEPF
ncbi:MAG: hypothetical protein FJY10_11070 [Bacteroidetes bacterium]|nr:hypothetical protein [Bacteroidota bacterium]